jgi:hypothetical protein
LKNKKEAATEGSGHMLKGALQSHSKRKERAEKEKRRKKKTTLSISISFVQKTTPFL